MTAATIDVRITVPDFDLMRDTLTDSLESYLAIRDDDEMTLEKRGMARDRAQAIDDLLGRLNR